MRTNLIDTTKLICSIVLTSLIFIFPVKSQTLTEMVNQLLDSHEDIINATDFGSCNNKFFFSFCRERG